MNEYLIQKFLREADDFSLFRVSEAIGEIASAITDWQQRQLMSEEQERMEWERFCGGSR